MAGLTGILCIVCLYDYRKQKIPNELIGLILLIGLIQSILQEGICGVGRYVVVSAWVVFLFYPLFRIGGLGAGDVKLLGACAGYFPAADVFSFLFISMLFSALFSMVKLIKEQNVRVRIAYFCDYCRNVVRSGKWTYYMPEAAGKRLGGVCMAGPILCSVLLRLGGVY